MTYYDFSRINDKEFEDLVIDLIKCDYPNINIERFMSGKDSGMDGRFYQGTDNIIIQSKHFIKSSYSTLKSKLREEASKLAKINPSRYILAVSQSLNNDRKQEIIDIIGKQYLRSDDILTIDDITHKVNENKNVERKYYKLWINSTSILTSILHNNIVGKSNHIINQIKCNSDIYVTTHNFNMALKKLENRKILIITGDPGVGKTTLAEQLCLHYILDNYELIYIENDIDEGDKIFEEDKKQLFLYDDFLGRNYLDALRNKEDSKIIRFINRINNSDKKILILTSRTTILNQGKSSSELFHINNTHNNEYEIELRNLDPLEKAKILYNHLWFSKLPTEYKDCIWKNKRYINIIFHKNYNPRLISFITDYSKIENSKPEDYWERIQSSLNNPSDIWDYMFTKQISKCAYYLTYLVSLNNGKITENLLSASYNNFIDIIKFDRSRDDFIDFKNCIQHSVKSTLHRKLEENKEPIYDVLNPSISDYLISKFDDNLSFIPSYFSALTSVSSVYNLSTLINKGMSVPLISDIINSICLNIGKKDLKYIFEFIKTVITNEKIKFDDKITVLNIIGSKHLQLDVFYNNHSIETLYIINGAYIFSPSKLENNEVKKYIELILSDYSEDLEHEDFKLIVNILNNIGDYNLLQKSYNLLLDYWKNHIHEYISESSEFHEFQDIELTEEMESKARDHIRNLLSEIPIHIEEDDFDNIFYSLDIYSIIEKNIENFSYWDDDDHHYYNGRDNMYKEINDLFSKE